jgi:hypothetical protein
MDNREEVRRECERLGELVVQARLESEHFGAGKAFAWEWLLEQHHRRLREESAERERAERALKAAEESASAARAAAAGAQSAARWAIAAALAAAAAVVVSLARYW